MAIPHARPAEAVSVLPGAALKEAKTGTLIKTETLGGHSAGSPRRQANPPSPGRRGDYGPVSGGASCLHRRQRHPRTGGRRPALPRRRRAALPARVEDASVLVTILLRRPPGREVLEGIRTERLLRWRTGTAGRWLYSTRGALTQARSASDGTVPSLALRACVNAPRVEYISPLWLQAVLSATCSQCSLEDPKFPHQDGSKRDRRGSCQRPALCAR